MKGYATKYGYMGYVEGVGYMLFATEEDYREFYEAREELKNG